MPEGLPLLPGNVGNRLHEFLHTIKIGNVIGITLEDGLLAVRNSSGVIEIRSGKELDLYKMAQSGQLPTKRIFGEYAGATLQGGVQVKVRVLGGSLGPVLGYDCIVREEEFKELKTFRCNRIYER